MADNQHSRCFYMVKKYYNSGRYTKEQVKIFVKAKMITKEEYQEITGEPYTK